MISKPLPASARIQEEDGGRGFLRRTVPDDFVILFAAALLLTGDLRALLDEMTIEPFQVGTAAFYAMGHAVLINPDHLRGPDDLRGLRQRCLRVAQEVGRYDSQFSLPVTHAALTRTCVRDQQG